MEIHYILILVGISCMGSFIQRVSGFGFGIFVMTILPHLLPSYGEATALSGMLAGSMSIVVALRMRKFIVWKEVLPILAIFAVVSFFAVGAVANFDDKMLKHVLGGNSNCHQHLLLLYQRKNQAEAHHFRPGSPRDYFWSHGRPVRHAGAASSALLFGILRDQGKVHRPQSGVFRPREPNDDVL